LYRGYRRSVDDNDLAFSLETVSDVLRGFFSSLLIIGSHRCIDSAFRSHVDCHDGYSRTFGPSHGRRDSFTMGIKQTLRVCLRARFKINESKQNVLNSSLQKAVEFSGVAGQFRCLSLHRSQISKDL
jgi:hypothetical protein